MVQYIKQGDVFGRLGTSIGQGLSEQVPKEVERARLASGLRELGQKQGLTPFQQFAELAGLPGVTPQMIQSGGDLLRQQARGQSLSQGAGQKPTTFPKIERSPASNQPSSNIPSLTKEDIFEKVQEGYIPPTTQERDAIAGQAFDSNPAFFNNDPQKAIDWANEKIVQEEKIAQAYQTKHANLNAIQDNVVKRLNEQSQRLNTKIPAELYSKIEDEAIQATKPKSQGGKGLTEQQAMKEYGNKLNDASRLISKIGELGNFGIMSRPASDTLSSMKQIQKEMETLGQTDNFAKEMILQNKISPRLAYAIAQPVSRVKNLNDYIKNLKDFSGESKESAIPRVMDISPKLAEFVKDDEKSSPLAIAHELDKKGYDGSTFLKYLNDNAYELNLRKRQSEQASTPSNFIRPLNDFWLSAFSGIE